VRREKLEEGSLLAYNGHRRQKKGALLRSRRSDGLGRHKGKREQHEKEDGLEVQGSFEVAKERPSECYARVHLLDCLPTWDDPV